MQDTGARRDCRAPDAGAKRAALARPVNAGSVRLKLIGRNIPDLGPFLVGLADMCGRV